MLGHVRDLGRDQYKDMHARGYQTASLLPFHNDSCDIVGLCCLETAKDGGLSAVASSVSVYNALLRSRPDLVKVLTQPFYADRRGEESEGQKPYYVTPIFIWHKGRMFNRFNRTFIDSAQRFNEVPRLTPLQIEALDAIAALCKDPTFRLDMKLERGDMQFVNNYCVRSIRGRPTRITRRRGGSGISCACGCERRPSRISHRRCATVIRTWTSGAQTHVRLLTISSR